MHRRNRTSKRCIYYQKFIKLKIPNKIDEKYSLNFTLPSVNKKYTYITLITEDIIQTYHFIDSTGIINLTIVPVCGLASIWIR